MHNYWLLLFGVIPFLLAIYLLWKEVTLRKGGVRTVGVIVAVKQEIVSGHEETSCVTFRPLVQFITHDGQRIVWKCTSVGTKWKNAQGQQMQIIYDHRNPRRVIRNHWSGYAWTVFLCFMSALCIVLFFTGAGG